MALLTEERYKQLVEYLHGARLKESAYPPNFTSNQKRGLRQQAACFEENDGILFHCSKDSKAKRKILRRVIVTQDEKNRIFRACHDEIDGGHYGRDKTLSKLRETVSIATHC